MRFRNLRRLLLPAFALLACSCPAQEALASDGSPDAYSSHGALTVSDGGTLTDVFGHNFTLNGISIDTENLNSTYLTQETFVTLKDELKVNMVRIPVWLNGTGGYCTGDDMTRAIIRSNVYAALNAAIYQDMYVILEWNLAEEQDLLKYRNEALAFFEDIATAYRAFPNIIYEIGSGKDTEDCSWEDMLPFETELIDCIRYYSPDCVVIVGLPDGGQGIYEASENLIQRDNLLYGYTMDPMDLYEEANLEMALADEELPLFVTGYSPLDEDGELLWQTSDTFLGLLNYYEISRCYSQLSSADADNSLLQSWFTGADSWNADAYTPSGNWFKAVMNGELAISEFSPDRFSSMGDEATPMSTEPVFFAGGGTWAFDNGAVVTVTNTGTWSDGAACYASYDIELLNTSAAPLANWKLRLFWDCAVGDKEYWSCQTAGEGSSRLIGPADYNQSIPAGSYAAIGIVVSGETTPVLNSVTFE